jgi:hypothetical protein
MSVADDLAIIARRFYVLARTASDPVTKLHLICLADSYVRQSHELKDAAAQQGCCAKTDFSSRRREAVVWASPKDRRQRNLNFIVSL